MYEAIIKLYKNEHQLVCAFTKNTSEYGSFLKKLLGKVSIMPWKTFSFFIFRPALMNLCLENVKPEGGYFPQPISSTSPLMFQ